MTDCQHHLERAAVGVCIRCRTPLCTECITKVDGINHCYACMAELAAVAAPSAAAPPASLPSWIAVGAGFFALALLSWTLLLTLLAAPGAP